MTTYTVKGAISAVAYWLRAQADAEWRRYSESENEPPRMPTAGDYDRAQVYFADLYAQTVARMAAQFGSDRLVQDPGMMFTISSSAMAATIHACMGLSSITAIEDGKAQT